MLTSAFRTMFTAVGDPIEIGTQPSSQTAVDGEATLSVLASSQSGESLSYQWQQSLSSGFSWSDISGATSTSLFITGLTFDPMWYRVKVTGVTSGRVVFSEAAVVRVPRIDWNTLPADTSAFNRQATFAASASMNLTDTVQYQWQVSTDNAATWSNISGATNSTLSLTGLTPSSDGYRYRCVATGTTYSATATTAINGVALSVPTTLVIVTDAPSSKTVTGGGGSFTIPLLASNNSSSPITYQWQYLSNGVYVNSSGDTASTLSATNVTYQYWHNDRWRCVATDANGSVTSTVTILSVTPVITVTGRYTTQMFYTQTNDTNIVCTATHDMGYGFINSLWQCQPSGSSTWSSLSLLSSPYNQWNGPTAQVRILANSASLGDNLTKLRCIFSHSSGIPTAVTVTAALGNPTPYTTLYASGPWN